ncbi:anti-sigma factor family protein [Labrys monachus]|uniref:Anti-sigma factor RsiW n=1 Tax=Labrys monachus TaxID=217067 RepID=A0ABU0FIR7_9HYPH|nr:hypothetical protein [Labrys monachus]MDQ0394508.1 anti-sigma factor RsiW [Labrys monachus]
MSADDATLVAFLDGALPEAERAQVERRIAAEPALKARLDMLAAGSRPFREAYAALDAHAPMGRLEAMLAESLAAEPAPAALPMAAPAAANRNVRLFRPAAVAAGLALFLIGAGVGHFVPAGLWPFAVQNGAQEGADAWRSAVAQYWGLTTSQTLVAMQHDAAATDRDLATATAKLGFPLTPDKVALPAQDLKRVELFHYDGAPLVEIAYLDELTGPLGFCIYANKPGTPAPPTLEQRRGFNIVHWSDAQRSYMLIGNGPEEIMQKIAAILARQVSA